MRELAGWEVHILAGLNERYHDDALRALARRLDMPFDALYRAITGRGGIGPRLLERIRQAEPMLVAQAFVPEGYTLTPLLYGYRTIVHDEGRPAGQEGPCILSTGA